MWPYIPLCVGFTNMRDLFRCMVEEGFTPNAIVENEDSEDQDEDVVQLFRVGIGVHQGSVVRSREILSSNNGEELIVCFFCIFEKSFLLPENFYCKLCDKIPFRCCDSTTKLLAFAQDLDINERCLLLTALLPVVKMARKNTGHLPCLFLLGVSDGFNGGAILPLLGLHVEYYSFQAKKINGLVCHNI